MSRPISILLIDDEEELVELYEMKLSSKAHKVATALTGNQAIAKMKQTNYELILCDINMPDGNGFDVYNFFRSSNYKASFAFITGHAKGSKELQEAEKTGAMVFNKPVRFDDIWNLIDKIALNSGMQTSVSSIKENSFEKDNSPLNKEQAKMSNTLEQKGMDLIRSINSKKK